MATRTPSRSFTTVRQAVGGPQPNKKAVAADITQMTRLSTRSTVSVKLRAYDPNPLDSRPVTNLIQSSQNKT